MKIEWHKPGERKFETGTDRGVLYPGLGAPGVPWNGLLSVQENVVGGEVTPYYYDGAKYLDFVANTDFQAVISAFTYPREFEEFDGLIEMPAGFTVTHQPRKMFDFSYRTLIGNDLEGQDHGYKIHLIWNCLAAPVTKSYATIGDNVQAGAFQWTLHTTPPPSTTFKPTAHIFVDSTRHRPDEMAYLESLLYGSDDNIPYLPSQTELVEILESVKDYGLTEPLSEFV